MQKLLQGMYMPIIRTYRPSPDALLNPRSDIIFKALFTQNSEDSRGALKSFLSAVIGRKVNTVTLLPNEPAAEDSEDKNARLDVACTFNDGDAADIEMQGVNENNSYGRRAEYLTAKLLNYVVPKGTDWHKIHQVFQISVLNFIFDPTDSSPVGRYLMRKKTGQPLAEVQNVIFLELPKLKNNEDNPKQLPDAQKWCKFFLEADNPQKKDYVHQLEQTEEGIMQAQKVLDHISSNDALWKKEFDRQVVETDRSSALHYAIETGTKIGIERGMKQGLEQGMQQGMQKGLQQGSSKAKTDIARSMKTKGYAFSEIAELTGLSESEIAAL